jgi:hypothetical protein
MLLIRTQLENFQNSKLCLLRAIGQTPGVQISNQVHGTIANSGGMASPARPRSLSPCPTSPQRPPPSPALARAKPRRRRTKKSHRRSPPSPRSSTAPLVTLLRHYAPYVTTAPPDKPMPFQNHCGHGNAIENPNPSPCRPPRAPASLAYKRSL